MKTYQEFITEALTSKDKSILIAMDDNDGIVGVMGKDVYVIRGTRTIKSREGTPESISTLTKEKYIEVFKNVGALSSVKNVDKFDAFYRVTDKGQRFAEDSYK